MHLHDPSQQSHSSYITPPHARHDSEVRRKKSGPALKAFFKIAEKWQLNIKQQQALLGWPAPSTYHKWKNGEHGSLSYDTLERISLLLGIYKALHILYPEEELADRWVNLPNTNPLFGGKPAIELMVNQGIDGLYTIRRLLDSRRGGWN